MSLFIDRREADRSDVVVLALPRGRVPVAYESARSLNAPLDIFLVRKLGVPGHEELASVRLLQVVYGAERRSGLRHNSWPFYGVGQWYQDFSQTSDDEVRMFLAQTAQEFR